MNQEKAHAALDEAFTDGVKVLFAVMVRSIVSGDSPDVVGARFNKGLTAQLDAHEQAERIIDSTIPE